MNSQTEPVFFFPQEHILDLSVTMEVLKTFHTKQMSAKLDQVVCQSVLALECAIKFSVGEKRFQNNWLWLSAFTHPPP